MTIATTPGARITPSAAPSRRAAAASAASSFDKQLKHAQELVSEGRRLLHAANRNLNAGTVLVRRTHQRLTDTEAYFRRTRPLISSAGR